MIAIFFAVIVGLARFTGGFLGVTVVVEVPRSNHMIVNVVLSGRTLIEDGRALTLGDGRVQMDDVTQTRLRNRGISITSAGFENDTFVINARIPIMGHRRVILRRQ